jgi:methyl-accepting chemotaxis protein
MKSIRTLLFMLVAAGIAAIGLLTLTSEVGRSLSETAVKRGMDAKDVVADILPPPMYLIELRLVLSMAADGTLPLDKAQTERERLVKEFNDRVTYWKQNPPYGLEAQLLGAQYEAGQRFIDASADVLKAVASKNRESASAALKHAHEVYLEHRQGVDETVTKANAFATQSLNDYDAVARNGKWVTWLAVICSTVMLGFLGTWARRAVWESTGGEPADVAKIANAVANGDLTVNVPVAQNDTTSVMAAMAHMCTNLELLLAKVRASSDSIATGSHQIASGSKDLSMRTEQQAANLQESASAMEEFNSTIRTTASTATEATKLAQSASKVAEQGAQVVGEVITTMDAITISSRKIAEITSVIDGIAFQTNILALNAAVEAARAGEQGRGFAIVAAEVRTLAQRTANAAKEINGLISSSVDNIESGAQLVAQAGSTMKDIVQQVRHVTELIKEISTAATEQTQGIGMVSQAVNQLDAATQQNASLVEESAAAASSLNEQAGELARAVGSFKVRAYQLHT